jgi:hypothetical protein
MLLDVFVYILLPCRGIMSVLMGRFLVSVFAEEDDGTGGRGSCGAGTLRSRSDIGGA